MSKYCNNFDISSVAFPFFVCYNGEQTKTAGSWHCRRLWVKPVVYPALFQASSSYHSRCALSISTGEGIDANGILLQRHRRRLAPIRRKMRMLPHLMWSWAASLQQGSDQVCSWKRQSSRRLGSASQDCCCFRRIGHALQLRDSVHRVPQEDPHIRLQTLNT